jgi:RimJ/RimL family protein N-acetyltransferase
LKDTDAYFTGYAFKKHQEGRPEAAQAVIHYEFEVLGANRIQAHCMAENLNSQKVLQKVGMQFEGSQRERIFFQGSLLGHETLRDFKKRQKNITSE